HLVPGDVNGVRDIFVHDRDADGNGVFDEEGPAKTSTVLVSVTSDGQQANEPSFGASISADGRFVAFHSPDPNLGADGEGDQVFMHDRDADGNGIFDERGLGRTSN